MRWPGGQIGSVPFLNAENIEQVERQDGGAPIRYNIYSSELQTFAAFGEAAEVLADRFGDALRLALGEAFPGREIIVSVQHHVSGYGSGLTYADPEDQDAIDQVARETLAKLTEPKESA